MTTKRVETQDLWATLPEPRYDAAAERTEKLAAAERQRRDDEARATRERAAQERARFQAD